MTFRQFVRNNVIRNKRIYAAYFLSSMFSVMVFFTFSLFAFHPTFAEEGIKEEALFGMAVAGGIIFVFSFFFVLYSMSSFLQSRKKEFGLLMIQGMSMRQIRFMVFLENMFIGVLATVIGILTGTLFAKLILLIAENILVIEQALYFYFPVWAIVLTLLSFTILFLVISFFVTMILRSKKLAELIKADQQPKQEPKASGLITILAVILLSAGYITAILAKGIAVVFVMIPVIIVVIIGTYLLFTQVSVFGINFLKRRKFIFWKKTNMILFSDLSFRLKDNARTFFMVAIISTVAFSAIGTLFGLKAYLTDGINMANPYSFTYSDDKIDEEQANEDINTINQILEKHDINVRDTQAILAYYDTEENGEVLIASESVYNDFAKVLGRNTLNLEENEMVGVKQNEAIMGDFNALNFEDQPVQLQNQEQLQLKEVVEAGVLPESFGHYVFSDEAYQQLPGPVQTEMNTVWKAASGQDEELIQVGEVLFNQMEPYNFQAYDYLVYSINRAFGPIMFIGLFIGIVFFVSAGSFLYFRLFTDLDEDQEKFATIAKIGLTDQELNKVITRQTAILFFAPIIVALIHGAVALTALSHLFEYNLVKESTIVLGSFLGMQVIYFLIVRFVYRKQLQSAI